MTMRRRGERWKSAYGQHFADGEEQARDIRTTIDNLNRWLA
ncbi:hypothetical protein [Paenibacillus tyrfis]|nr:hypothetical protein [Paenibacillus tyrfis]